MTRSWKSFPRAAAVVVFLALAGGANGQFQMMINAPVAAGQRGMVSLPFMAPDGIGGTWSVYNDGGLRQQMGPSIYAQGGMLLIDGNNFTAANNQGSIAAKTGELVLENPQVNGLEVTRRLLFDKETGYVRYVDVLHNQTDQDRSVNVVVQTVLNWGVQQGQVVSDPKRKDQNLAWVAMTGAGKAVLEVYAGSGGKVLPTINYQNNNMVQANYTLTVPAGKETALVHLHMFVPSLEAGQQFVANMKSAALLHSIPADLRRRIVNFNAGEDWLQEVDVLRGDVLDIVELRGGDQFKGTLQENSYKLNTFYGSIELPTQRVIAMVNAGSEAPRQLLVTDDGEFFGGRLAEQTIHIALSSGQVVAVPMEQISRLGYRKRAGEPQEWTYDKPMVLLRGGDRVTVLPPAQSIPVATRYGLLALDPATVAAIVFQPAEGGVHEIDLDDGSKLSGLVAADVLQMQLNGAAGSQTVSFPVSSILRLQLAAKTPDADPDGPTMQLTNQDVLCASLEGELKLQTAFDTIVLQGPQIRRISAAADQMQVTLWDGSTISGQIIEAAAQCRLLSGTELNVPVSLLREYDQPHPLPSAEMVTQIQATAADLNADDWRARDRAEAALTAMGPAVIGVLRDLRPKAAPEAQQRIDAIIKQFQSAPKPAPARVDNKDQ